MMSSSETDTPKCPNCNAPMRLTRVLPTVLPKACGTETHVLYVRAAAGRSHALYMASSRSSDPIDAASSPRLSGIANALSTGNFARLCRDLTDLARAAPDFDALQSIMKKRRRFGRRRRLRCRGVRLK
jgi:hypothetical protein